MGALKGNETPEQVADAMVPARYTGNIATEARRLVADAVAADREARGGALVRAADSGKIDHTDKWVDVAITELARKVIDDSVCFAALDVIIALHADRKRIAAEWDGLKRPSGIPFAVVTTEAAEDALNTLVGAACAAGYHGDDHEIVASVLAHREHLRRQVNEVQATATEQQTAKRIAEYRLRGAMAWVVGDTASANPYDNMRDNMAWSAWHVGWCDADRASYTNKSFHGKR